MRIYRLKRIRSISLTHGLWVFPSALIPFGLKILKKEKYLNIFPVIKMMG